MSSQGLLFGMVPVYLTNSLQITNNVFVQEMGHPVSETQASLFGVYKVVIQSILVPCVGQIQEEGVPLGKGPLKPSRGHCEASGISAGKERVCKIM